MQSVGLDPAVVEESMEVDGTGILNKPLQTDFITCVVLL